MARILKETEAEELVFNQDGSWSLPNGKLAITERALRSHIDMSPRFANTFKIV